MYNFKIVKIPKKRIMNLQKYHNRNKSHTFIHANRRLQLILNYHTPC